MPNWWRSLGTSRARRRERCTRKALRSFTTSSRHIHRRRARSTRCWTRLVINSVSTWHEHWPAVQRRTKTINEELRWLKLCLVCIVALFSMSPLIIIYQSGLESAGPAISPPTSPRSASSARRVSGPLDGTEDRALSRLHDIFRYQRSSVLLDRRDSRTSVSSTTPRTSVGSEYAGDDTETIAPPRRNMV